MHRRDVKFFLKSSAKTSERIGRAGSLLGRTRIMADALGELSVALAQVMGANVARLHLSVSRD
jgi:hypothetical protein